MIAFQADSFQVDSFQVISSSQSSITADAVLVTSGGAVAQSFSLNAFDPAFETGSGAFSGSVFADAILRKHQTQTFTANAVLKKIRTFTADVVLKKHQSATSTADAILRKSQARTLTADAVLKLVRTITANAVLRKAQTTKTVLVDASLVALSGVGAFQGNAFQNNAFQVVTFNARSSTIDAVLKKNISSFVTVNAVLAFGSQVRTVTINAVLIKRTTQASFTADAVIASPPSLAGAFDGSNFEGPPGAFETLTSPGVHTFTANTVLKRAGTVRTVTVDAWLTRAVTRSITSDAILRRTGNVRTFTANATLLVHGRVQKQFTADAALVAAGSGLFKIGISTQGVITTTFVGTPQAPILINDANGHSWSVTTGPIGQILATSVTDAGYPTIIVLTDDNNIGWYVFITILGALQTLRPVVNYQIQVAPKRSMITSARVHWK